jgi:hypothetical protein
MPVQVNTLHGDFHPTYGSFDDLVRRGSKCHDRAVMIDVSRPVKHESAWRIPNHVDDLLEYFLIPAI